MRDESLTTLPGLSAAEAAVNYVLKRIKVDANLRYHMIGTESLRRLCIAEAQRTGQTQEQVDEFFSTPADHCKDDKPRLIEYRNMANSLAQKCRKHNLDTEPWGAEIIEKLERMS